MISSYKFVGVKPLPDEEALAKGANFLSELFIFTVAGIVMTLEVWRSDYQNSIKTATTLEKEQEKNKLLNARFEELTNMIDDIKESLPIESRKKYERLKKIRAGEPIPPELELEPSIPTVTPQPEIQNNQKLNKNYDWSWVTSWFH